MHEGEAKGLISKSDYYYIITLSYYYFLSSIGVFNDNL